MSPNLERQYARLLHLYPARYRRERGAELLETLLESAEPGRSRPAAREVAALVLGALRAHAGREHRDNVQHGRWVACHAAALMLLVYDLAGRALAILVDLSYGPPSRWSPADLILNVLALTLGAYAVIAATRRRYGRAVTAASTAFLITATLAWSMGTPVFSGFWSFPLAVVLLLPLLRHRPPSTAGLIRYAPVLPFLVVLTEEGLSQLFPDVAGMLRFGVFLALCVGGLLWLAVDERLTMAWGLLLLNGLLLHMAWMVAEGVRSFTDVALAMAATGFMPAVLLLTAYAAARRRARI